MLRGLMLRLLFVKTYITYRKQVNFRGWCVIHSFPGSYIKINGGG